MRNYAKQLPRDESGAPMQEYPAPVTAYARYNSLNAVTSSVISFNPNSSALEVGSFGAQGVVIRWIPTTETAAVSPFASIVSSGAGANYDHYIPGGTVRRFVIPMETGGNSQNPNSQRGSVNGLYQRVAWINAGGPASVIASES